LSQPASKTVANATLEALLTPKLEPGKACLIVIRGRSVGHLLELQKLPSVVGRAPDVELMIDDVAVSRRHAQIEKGAEGFAVQDLGSTNGLFVNGLRVQRQLLHDGDRIQVGTTTILKFCFQDELEASFQKTLYDSATRDSLTGLYNRRFFLDTLDIDFAYSFRNETALSLLLLDLDHFKEINDSFGHSAGDSVLRQTSGLIQKGLRTEDVAARHGGEEFAVLLRYTDAPAAYAIAERIRQSIEEHRFEHEARVMRVTASIGLASLEARCYRSWQGLIEAADSFLYRAKEQGRNRTHYGGLESRGRLTQTTVSIQPEELQSPGDPQAGAGEPKPAAKGAPKRRPRKR
jgi:two-component system cell cycle response regulator